MPLDFFADTSNWLKELFHVEKPIIAMCHLLPLLMASCSPTNIPFLI